MMGLRLKETAEDIAVKERFWASLEAELTYFAERYAGAHVVGAGETQEQEGIVDTAKAKGYPMGVVRRLASLIRRDLRESDDYQTVLSDFRSKINLMMSG